MTRSISLVIVVLICTSQIVAAKVKLRSTVFKEFQSALSDSSTTDEALTRIEVVRRQFDLDSGQKRSLSASEKKWRERDKEGLIRFGTRWTTEEDAIKSNLDANRQIDRAMEKLGERDYRAAASVLERAGREDAGGVRAPFALGFLHLTKSLYDPEQARRQFEVVLKRAPNHPPALNNAALASVRVGKYADAFRYWRMALDEQPDSPEIRHNIARMQALSAARTQKLVMSSSQANRFVELRGRFPADAATSTTVGFLYSPLILSKIEKSAEFKRSPHKVNSEGLIIDTMGSGFVCAPEFVITNRHIVGSAVFGQCEAMKVLDSSDPIRQKMIDATVIAVSPTMDIALIHCPGLKARPLTLQTDEPVVGSDVNLHGYPRTAEPGTNSETLPLTVTAIPDAKNRGSRLGGLLMFDGDANAGHSGGPVLDNNNRVLGLFVMGTIGIGVYHGGVAASDVKEFLNENIAGYQPPAEVNDNARSSTVQIVTYRVPVAMELEKHIEGAPRIDGNSSHALRQRFLEDKSCVVCRGRSKNDCPANKCLAGTVSIKKYRTVVLGRGQTRRVVKQVYFDKKACSNCRGTGLVDCKHCTTGIDPAIR